MSRVVVGLIYYFLALIMGGFAGWHIQEDELWLAGVSVTSALWAIGMSLGMWMQAFKGIAK